MEGWWIHKGSRQELVWEDDEEADHSESHDDTKPQTPPSRPLANATEPPPTTAPASRTTPASPHTPHVHRTDSSARLVDQIS